MTVRKNLEKNDAGLKSNYLEEAPDGGWGWLIVVGGMYSLAMWGGIVRCYSVFFRPLMAEFDVEYGTVAWLSGMFQISYGVFTFIGPIAMKRFERRPMSLIASAICGFSCFLSSFSTELWQVQVLLGSVVGCCMGIISINVFTVTTRYFDKRLHSANQLLCLGISLGPLLICPGIQQLVTMYGWRGACQITAGMFLNMSIASAFMRPIKLQSDLEDLDINANRRDEQRRNSASPKKRGLKPKFRDLRSLDAEIVGSQSIGLYTPTITRRNANSHENGPHEHHDSKVHKSGLEKEEEAFSVYMSSGLLSDVEKTVQQENVLRERCYGIYKKYDLYLFVDPLFYLYSMSWIGFASAYFSAFTYIIPYGISEMGLTDIQASMLLSAFAGGEIFSRVIYGLFFDRLPQRFRILYISILYAAFSLAVLIFPFVPGHVGIMVCCACLGVLGGGTDGIFSALIAELFSVRVYATVFGYSNIFTHSMGMATTVLIGSAVDRFGNLAVPFYIGSVTAAVSSVTSFIMHKLVEKRRRLKNQELSDVTT